MSTPKPSSEGTCRYPERICSISAVPPDELPVDRGVPDHPPIVLYRVEVLELSEHVEFPSGPPAGSGRPLLPATARSMDLPAHS